jgi:hypothetical protein
MGERIGRIGRIRTDFFCHSVGNFMRDTKDSYGMTREIQRANG